MLERFKGGEGESQTVLALDALIKPRDKQKAMQGVAGLYRDLLLAKLTDEGE